MIKGIIINETAETVAVLTFKSSNRKTGALDTVWLLNRHMNPIDAKSCGADKVICFDCPLRSNGCYVNVAHAPNAIYKAYKNDRYIPLTQVPERFWDTKKHSVLRLGGYGDPFLLHKHHVDFLAEKYKSILGYTYQWAHPSAEYLKPFCMASVHNNAEALQAMREGWSTFHIQERVSVFTGAKYCPADIQGSYLQCVNCRLCCGNSKGQKQVCIKAHGFQTNKAKGV